jgi:dipeptidyl aminopeptidase/acylaminoacyl peptidase
VTGPPIGAAAVARTRSLADPRVSPDGSRLGWVESFAGRADLVVAARDGSGPPVTVTSEHGVASGPGAYAWAGPGHVVLVAADGRLVVVPVAGGPSRVLVRDGRAAVPAVSPDGRLVACVIERDDVCDIAVVPLDGSAWPARVSTGAAWTFDPAWSADGTRLAWHEWDEPDLPWDGSRLAVRAVTGAGGSGPVHVVAGGAGATGGAEAVGQPRWSPDGRYLAWVSDRTGWMVVWVGEAGADVRGAGAGARPLLEEEHEHAEPTWGPGQRSYAWSPDGRAIALCRNESGYGRLVVAAVDGGGPTAAGRAAAGPTGSASQPAAAPVAQLLGRAWHHGLEWAGGGPGGPGGPDPEPSGGRRGEILAVRTGGVTVPQLVAVAADGSGRRVLARGAPAGFEPRDGWAGPVEPEPVTWAGADGATVHGLVYRPRPDDGRAPVLVWIHGGPTGQATAQWSGRIQYHVARGWAVLAPNFRGSTGYGRAYRAALDERWGELDLADTVAGIRSIDALGVGDPGRVAVLGGSAGGLTALLVCARHGDLVRAGVSLYGVTDLFELAETTHRYERYSDRRLVGERPAAVGRFRNRSPITHAASIRVPLLLLHGSRDVVVPPAQAAALAAAVAAAGIPVEHHVYEGEGHGWSRPETVEDELRRVERFLARWVLER